VSAILLAENHKPGEILRIAAVIRRWSGEIHDPRTIHL
jgi:hypothetical protein